MDDFLTETSPTSNENENENGNENGNGNGNVGTSRRTRTVTETLGSIVLACELVVVFLAALVAFGLDALAPLSLPPAACLIVGGILCAALVVAIAVLSHPWGRMLGWALQVIIIATGFFVPVMFFIGALFGAMWAYAIITGKRIDHRKQTLRRSKHEHHH